MPDYGNHLRVLCKLTGNLLALQNQIFIVFNNCPYFSPQDSALSVQIFNSQLTSF